MADPSRLFLITPPIGRARDFASCLESAMAAADVACVLLRLAEGEDRAVEAIVRALAPIVQAQGAALLVADDARCAARTAVDGVHIGSPGERLDAALAALRPRQIVGVGGLESRDAAMSAGEQGVDYVMFGGPGEQGGPDAVLDRVAWWAEIFTVPCVGYAASPAHAGAIARAGAEFVGLCEGLWDDPRSVGATLAAVAADLHPVDAP